MTTHADKRGWLKKQGGLVKSWQRRWFVLQGLKLHYFTKDDESKLLGVIELSGNRVVEIPFTRDEPDRWLFEITPGKGNKMTATHDTYPLWAANEQERIEWISALRRAVYKDCGGGVFGSPLSVILDFDKKAFGLRVPHIVHQCVERIRAEGKEVEGIFRLSGRISQVKDLKKRYDEGERPDFGQEGVDIHTTASLLKLYFRELPEPVIPFEYFEAFLNLGTSFRYQSNHDETLQNLKVLLKELPEENYYLLDYLTGFLSEISKFQDINKMTEKNISLIFGTNILRCEDNSPEFQMATQNLTTHVLIAFVKWHDPLFSEDVAAMNQLVVDPIDVQQLVNISDEAEILSEPVNQELVTMQTPLPGLGVSDLLDINFALSPSDNHNIYQQTSQQEGKEKSPPPPIPPRSADKAASFDNVSMDSGVIENGCTGKNSLEQSVSFDLPSVDRCLAKPVPTPRGKLSEPGVTKRSGSAKRPNRPVPLDPNVGYNVQRKSGTLPKSRADKETSGFQSYIDSPLDSQVSLHLGDLPSSVEDLQALVLSLKIEVKEQRRTNEKLLDDLKSLKARYKTDIEIMAAELQQEKAAKDDAIMRIVDLNSQLVMYQSQYGLLES